jgi:hypothetical protein
MRSGSTSICGMPSCTWASWLSRRGKCLAWTALGESAGICRGLSCGNHPITLMAGSRHGFRCRGLRRVCAVKECSPPRSRQSLRHSSSYSLSSACLGLPRNSGATAVAPLDAGHQHSSGLVALPSGPCPAGTPPDDPVYPWPFRVLFL